jgi:F-type H+-transporting ATPase subunit delta
MSGRVARRYAKALFALAREAGALDAVAAELAALRIAFSDPNTAELLADPMMTAARLTALVQGLGSQLRLSNLTTNFLGVLAANRRIDQLAGIHDRFEQLHDQVLGRVRATIRSAAPLATAQQNEVVAVFEKLAGKVVLPTVETDPDLLGGLVVETEGKVYDGSLRTQLEHLAREITGARTYL